MKAEQKKGREQRLTDKQIAFCKAYSACNNAAEAARIAGYNNEGEGWRCMKSAAVTKELERLARERELEETDSRFVVKQLKDLVLRCTEGKTGKGKDGQTEGTTYDNNNAVKALELLGKYLGMFNGKAMPLMEERTMLILPEPPDDL